MRTFDALSSLFDMNYKDDANITGFVIPDFEFESDNPVFPISTPSNNTYHFDLREHFDMLKNARGPRELCRQLGFFKAALISNAAGVGGAAALCEEAAHLLFDLINPNQNGDVLYDAICTCVALTGVSGATAAVFRRDFFVRFVVRVAVVSLSDPNFRGRSGTGQAALALLRNLLYSDNDIRIFFIQGNGLELMITLYFELTDAEIKNHLIWILYNSLDVVPKITLEIAKPFELFLKSVFGFSLPFAESTEIKLAVKFVMIDDDFAFNFLNLVDLDFMSSNLVKASDETQIELLDLFLVLILHKNNQIAEKSFNNIKWNSFVTKIPMLYSDKVKKKLSEFAEKVFMANTVNTKLLFETEMFPSLIKMISYGKYSVRLKALTASSKIIHTNCEYVVESIIGSHMISQIIPFLETDWYELIKFGLEFLIVIIEFALNKKYKKEVLKELCENDIHIFISEIIEKALSDEINDLCFLLRTKIEILEELDEYSEFSYEEELIDKTTEQLTDNNEYHQIMEEENIKNNTNKERDMGEDTEEEDIEWVDADEEELI